MNKMVRNIFFKFLMVFKSEKKPKNNVYDFFPSKFKV